LGKSKGKPIPLLTWTGPEGSRSLRLPYFKTMGAWKRYICQPLYTGRLYNHRKYLWHSFLLEAKSTNRAIVRPEGLCQ